MIDLYQLGHPLIIKNLRTYLLQIAPVDTKLENSHYLPIGLVCYWHFFHFYDIVMAIEIGKPRINGPINF